MDKNNSLKKIFMLLTLSFCTLAFGQIPKTKIATIMEAKFNYNFTQAIKKAYPKNFVCFGFETADENWFIDLQNGNTIGRFYLINGRILPKRYVNRWQNYYPVFVDYYPQEIPNPKNFSNEYIEELKVLADGKSRKDSFQPSMTLVQTFLYNAKTPAQIERYIVTTRFMDWKVRIHKDLVPRLKQIQIKLNQEALVNQEVAKFLAQRVTITGYNWREVRDSEKRSSHSWGISIDIMPKYYGLKQIYWKWTKDFYQDGWITMPLNKRWIPPLKVISIFESEGFIWGGKWEIWDNMHFEYHPELLLLSKNSNYSSL